MIAAPVLQLVAGTLAGADPTHWSDDAMRWAYAVREAVTMVKPTWVVSHFDLGFEARAISELASEPDEVWDVEVEPDGPFAPGITLVRTLVELDPRWTVAASVTGPLRLARALAGPWEVADQDLDELEEACGDVIAALVAAYAQAGAAEVLVWEPAAAERPSQAEAAHAAIARRAALADAPLTLVGRADIDGYARAMGSGVLLVPPEAARDAEAWRSAVAGASAGDVVVTDGPVPGDAPPEALLALSHGDSAT